MPDKATTIENLRAGNSTNANWRLGFWKRFELFKNSYLQVRFFYKFVVKDGDYDIILKGGLPGSRLGRMIPRLVWFWPRITDSAVWARGDFGTLRTPENFKTLDPLALILVDAVERVTPNRNAYILDLGCNMGRHLSELYRRGYRRLCGVDVMAPALFEFRRVEPAVYGAAEVHHDLFQRFLVQQSDRKFDTVYTHGATIELVHPSFDIVGHLCRVAGNHVVLLINEWCQSYPRMWEREFRLNGFALVSATRPADGGAPAEDSANLLIFRRDRGVA